jgi:hypothetical protein
MGKWVQGWEAVPSRITGLQVEVWGAAVVCGEGQGPWDLPDVQ